MGETFNSAMRVVRDGWRDSSSGERAIHATGCCVLALMQGASFGWVLTFAPRPWSIAASLFLIACSFATACGIIAMCRRGDPQEGR